MEIREAETKITILIEKFGTAQECQIILPDKPVESLSEGEMIIIMLGLAALESKLKEKVKMK